MKQIGHHPHSFAFNCSDMYQLLRSLASYYRSSLCLNARHANGPYVSHISPIAVWNPSRWYLADHVPGSNNKSSEGISNQKQASPCPSGFHFPTWAKMAVGSILTLFLSFWSKQWSTILRIQSEVEAAAEVVEEAADIIEKVATVAEKMASEVAEDLPDDSKIKDAVLLIEHVSREAEEEAALAKDIIHKVDEIKEDVEMMLDPKKTCK